MQCRCALLAWAGVASLLTLGCGGGDGRPSLFPATGSVRVGDKPAAGVRLRFYPADRVDDPDTLKPTATTGDDGRFALGTYADGVN